MSLFAVHTLYGTPDELKLLVNEAHKRNMIVIFDFVANHMSSRNILQWWDGTNLYFDDGASASATWGRLCTRPDGWHGVPWLKQLLHLARWNRVGAAPPFRPPSRAKLHHQRCGTASPLSVCRSVGARSPPPAEPRPPLASPAADVLP